ncbi:MAG: tetratricopeptide repeat-containing sensor histidine kinase [Balneolales bacterium]|nr:tetratricopeptide repeat-containing sensor histidine kinase [Balneolales bacterium]
MRLTVILLCLFYISCNDTATKTHEHSELPERYVELNDLIEERFYQNDFPTADSLLNVLYSYTIELGDPEYQVGARLERAFFMLRVGNYHEGIEFLEALEDSVFTLSSEHRQHIWHTRMAQFHNEIGNFQEAIDFIIPVIESLEEQGIKNVTYVSSLSTYGTLLRDLNRHDEALEHMQNAITIANDLDLDPRIISIIHNNTALILQRLSRDEDALDELLKSLEINRRLDNLQGMAHNMNNISNALKGLGRYEAAIDTLRNALALNTTSGYTPSVIRNYYNLGKLMLEIDSIDEAENYFRLGYDLSDEIRFSPGTMYNASGLAGVYVINNQHNLARQYAEEAKMWAVRMTNIEIQTEMQLYLSQIHEKEGRYREALEEYKLHQVFADSLNRLRNQRSIEEVRSRFSFDIINAENELLRQNLEFSEEQSQTQLFYLIAFAIGKIIIIILLVVLVRQKKLIEQKNSYLKELNNARQGLVNMIVHDLRSPLSGLISSIEILKEEIPQGNSDVQEMLRIADMSAEKLRKMINGLLDVNSIENEDVQKGITKVNITEMAKRVVSDYEIRASKKSITISTKLVPLEIQFHLEYISRILDNLLSNAIKYSHADTKIHVAISKIDKEKWELTVTDQGQGFSDWDKREAFKLFTRLSAQPTADEASTGIGLYTIKLLTEKLGGTIELQSEKGKGSTFTCIFPANL